MTTTPLIIGGMFGLETMPAEGATPPPFLREGARLLLNARCGIWTVLEQVKPRQVWMPSYLCGAMLSAVDRRKTRIRFYPVDCNLVLAARDWLADVNEGDVVLFIDYFGYPCDAECARAAKQRGAWVLEDACQALLSRHVGAVADYVIYSPRKFLGVPDGGVLLANRGAPLTLAAEASAPDAWLLKALEAGIQRREFDRHGGERRWFELFQEIEAGMPVGSFAMSEVARSILMHGSDYEALAGRRRENYAWLVKELPELAVLPDLPPDVVPLGFPVRHPQRDTIRRGLFEENIYPPVHWPVPAVVPSEFADARRLAGDIMTLPCDQRYGRDDMDRMIRAIRAGGGN